jgi:site-specific DNA-methyltransferase (adenine-specific)
MYAVKQKLIFSDIELVMLELLNIDCMDYMSGLEDNAFDLAIVDPPYGIGAPKMSATPNERKKRILNNRLNLGCGKLKNRVLNNSNCEWDNEIPNNDYFNEIRRVSVNQIIWGGNYFDLPPTRGIICWDKMQPWPNFSAWEMAWTSFDNPAKLFKFDNRTGDKIHPTQKPVRLYDWLLQNYATSGMRILDTHLGSGSSAIAAHYFGCDFVGCEIDKDYFEAAQKRFKRETRQLSFEYASA